MILHCVFQRRLAVLACAMSGPITIAIQAAALEAQNKIAWHHQFPTPVTSWSMLTSGAVGITTGEGFTVLAGSDGHEMWRIPEACCAYSFSWNTIVIRQPRKMAVYEVERGEELWPVHRVALDTVMGTVAITPRNLLLAYGWAKGALRVTALSLDSGQVLWRTDTLLQDVRDLIAKEKVFRLPEGAPVVYDTDTTLFIYPTRGGPRLIDARTGALLWRVPSLAREVAPRGPGYARVAMDSNVVLVPFERDLAAVRVSDGTVLWQQEEHFPSRLAEIAITPHGYLVRGYFKGDEPSVAVSPFLDLLDPATGKSRWGKPIKDLDRASAMMVRGDTVWLASQKRLMSVSLPGGAYREHARFEFKGDELPNTIEDFRDLNGAFVLLAGHNLVGVAPSGEVRFQRYFSAPGQSFWTKALALTLEAGIAAAICSDCHYTSHSPRPVASPYGRGMLLEARFAYMLTGAEDSTGTHGFSVVKVDKVTGQEVGRAWVHDRSPDYRIDAKEGMLYLLRDKLTLEAIRF